jgi:hypothetical protein
MKPCFSIRRVVCLVPCSGRDHADGVRSEANVLRPSAFSFISLRRAHRRRDQSEPRSIGRHYSRAVNTQTQHRAVES